MRRILAFLFLALALWQGFRDWQVTLGEGYAFRMASAHRVWAEVSPGSFQSWVPALSQTGVPYLWDPIALALLGLPLAGTLWLFAAFFWLIRRRTPRSDRRR